MKIAKKERPALVNGKVELMWLNSLAFFVEDYRPKVFKYYY